MNVTVEVRYHMDVELALIVTAGVTELTLTKAVPENSPITICITYCVSLSF